MFAQNLIANTPQMLQLAVGAVLVGACEAYTIAMPRAGARVMSPQMRIGEPTGTYASQFGDNTPERRAQLASYAGTPGGPVGERAHGTFTPQFGDNTRERRAQLASYANTPGGPVGERAHGTFTPQFGDNTRERRAQLSSYANTPGGPVGERAHGSYAGTYTPGRA